MTNSAISFQVFFASWSTSSSFSRSLQQRWPLIGLGCARDDRRARYPRPAQLLRFLKSGNCACVKISPRVWGILGDVFWNARLKIVWPCTSLKIWYVSLSEAFCGPPTLANILLVKSSDHAFQDGRPNCGALLIWLSFAFEPVSEFFHYMWS